MTSEKIKIYDLMVFVEIIREIKTKNLSLPKISILVQIVDEILPQLCSNEYIQILLKASLRVVVSFACLSHKMIPLIGKQ